MGRGEPERTYILTPYPNRNSKTLKCGQHLKEYIQTDSQNKPMLLSTACGQPNTGRDYRALPFFSREGCHIPQRWHKKLLHIIYKMTISFIQTIQTTILIWIRKICFIDLFIESLLSRLENNPLIDGSALCLNGPRVAPLSFLTVFAWGTVGNLDK